MPILKKGSAAAKAFMAKLRAARGKNKPKAKKDIPDRKYQKITLELLPIKKIGAKKTATKKVGAVKLSKQKLIDIADDYAYATSGNYDRAVYNLLDPDFTKILLPKYKAAIKAFEIKNKTKVRATISKKVGATKKVMPTKKASSMHKDTKSHNVNIKVMSGINNLKNLKTDTFDIVFNNDNNSNNKGFAGTLKYCKDYIKGYNGTGYSYFGDYIGGIVQIINNRTGIIVYETQVKPIKKNRI